MAKLIPTTEPSKEVRLEIYKLYEVIYYSKLSYKKRRSLMSSIFAWEHWSWKVDRISYKALKKYKENNFKYTAGLHRDHYVLERAKMFDKMLTEKMNFNDWWNYFWENDKVQILTKEEHDSKNNSSAEIKTIHINWEKGYFPDAGFISFKYRKTIEGKFLEDLYNKEFK